MKFLKWFGIILLGIIVLLGVIVAVYLQHPMFGADPSGDRLARIQQSPNYHDGQFWNLTETPMMTPDENGENDTSIFSRLKGDTGRRYSSQEIPSVKTDLKSLPKNQNTLVRLGHSAYFMILDGKTYLVDPTLVSSSPVWFVNKPFPGTSVYLPEDIPEIDYLIITHDHYDHLDYFTMKEIRDKVGKVITSLGVGAHFERWGFDEDDIIEMDRYDESDFDDNIKITCLPARHYSGRLKQNKTLRSSFMLETPSKTIYIGGDSGYDKFFKEIGEKWPNIDLAVIENGQYDMQRKYIHMLPDDVVQAIKDLNAKKVLTVHNSKYAMANHDWDEPMIALDEKLHEELIDSWITPMIGEVVELDNNNQKFTKWRENLDNNGIKNNPEIIQQQNNLPTNAQEMNNSQEYFVADKVLNNGIKMPSLGLGTWTLSNEEAEKAVYEAIKDGYRLIDTAQYYGNEVGVGNGVRKAIEDGLIKREDVFVTSKIYASSDHAAAIKKSLSNLDIDYIDLLLIHQPGFDDKGLYQTMEEYYKQGKLKSIGISNYYTKEAVDEVLSYAEIQPAVIQNENHIYYQNTDLQDYVKQYGIFIESWYPFGGRGNTSENFNNEVIKELAEKYNKISAQIILRWHLQAGYIVIPGSSNPDHIAENYNIFDFELSDYDMQKISEIDQQRRYENR